MSIREPVARNRAVNRRAAVMLGLLLSGCLGACTPDDRPEVFYHLSGQGSLVRQYFGMHYRIVNVDDRRQRYTPPKYLGGLQGRQAAAGGDACLEEHAWLLFIVTAEGAVTTPQVVDTSPNLPSKVAIERVETMRFEPATLDGKPVSAVADFHLGFNCPIVPGHRR